jgi:hypothetical protein
MQAQSKDHRRSAMIQNMRVKLREQELVSDVLKQELQRTSGLSPEEVTCGPSTPFVCSTK